MEEKVEPYSSDSDSVVLPEEIVKVADEVSLNLLPERSKNAYLKEYDRFMEWCNKKGIENFSESVLLAYFGNKTKETKSSTLWSNYSKLKATLNLRNNVDISKYAKLTAYLKQKSVGYKPKRSKTLTREEINKFLLTAPDDVYLMMKVCLIFGIAGACRRDELCRLSINDIEDKGSVLLIKIADSKTGNQRIFTVIGETDVPGLNWIEIYRKYVNLRPKHVVTKRFFLQYRAGKCSIQVVGINSFSKVPSTIARFLNLQEPNAYTGHCFRRTSASLSFNSGGAFLRRLHQYASSTFAPGNRTGYHHSFGDTNIDDKTDEAGDQSLPTTNSTNLNNDSVPLITEIKRECLSDFSDEEEDDDEDDEDYVEPKLVDKSWKNVAKRCLRVLTDKYSQDEDDDLLYLKSLLPDIKKLSGAQKRKFKQGIYILYDDVINQGRRTRERSCSSRAGSEPRSPPQNGDIS